MPTIVQVPPPWAVIRLAVRMGAAGSAKIPMHRWIGARLDWLFSRPSAWLHQSATLRFLAEFMAAVALVIALVGFWLEVQNREEDRVNRAWSLVAAAKEVQGNVGLIEALEMLNARRIDMSRLEMPSAYLHWVRLEGARLDQANLTKADLVGANLTGAYLESANLSEADLMGAVLTKANLTGADLSGAYLRA
jgi:hypothetical protein